MTQRRWTCGLAVVGILLATTVSAAVVEIPASEWRPIDDPLSAGKAAILVRFELPSDMVRCKVEAAYCDIPLLVTTGGGDRVSVAVHELLEPITLDQELHTKLSRPGAPSVGAPAGVALLEYGDADLGRLEVTDIVQAWINEARANHGFVITVEQEDADFETHIDAGVPRQAGSPILRLWVKGN